jgi:YD repeat-containing protein
LTLFSYDDLNRIVTTSSDKDLYNDQLIKTQVVYDGLGREVETRQYESTNALIATRKEYDALGRLERVSNPFRLAPQYWTVTQYDALSRVTAVIAPGNAATTTGYSGNVTTVTDPSGNPRRSLTDALGRPVRVDEPDENKNLGAVTSPYQATAYLYDALDNLRTVTQGGQTRTFVYDSLSQLTAATNPESGTVNYLYDLAGNLRVKTDARGTVTCYGIWSGSTCDSAGDLAYDGLNRPMNKTYSDGTPAVSYCYDGVGTGCPTQIAYAVGRPTKLSSAVSSTSYDEYSPLGRVKRSTQEVGQSGYTFFYGYNLAGSLKSQVYPSGRTVTTDYDPALRTTLITGTKSGEPGKTYASNFLYSPHGGVEAMKLGNELWESAHYNERLQPDLMGLSRRLGSALKYQISLAATRSVTRSLNPAMFRRELLRPALLARSARRVS